jgi:formylglycine-generating enzyme required for sulfatase activity
MRMNRFRVSLVAAVAAVSFVFRLVTDAAEPVPTTGTGGTPQTATKGVPFANTLGMKFVPVPGTKVLFCVWETRVKDYREYAKSAGGVNGSWEKPGFAQTEESPVVNVSWDDAQAFCAWLSKKEGLTYRLPTDLEWSAAVGLGEEPGKYPAYRSDALKGYAWGNRWPPPKNAGNYAAHVGVDSFVNTAPVGSFAANALGIHDLSGNVWEWCEDKFDSDGIKRTKRGGGFNENTEEWLRASRRAWGQTSDRYPSEGFRCVLVK